MKIPIILVIMFYGIGDIISTYFAINSGGVEGNPLLAHLIKYNFLLMVLFKIVVIVWVYKCYNSLNYWISIGASKKITKALINFSVTFTIFIGLIATINNIITYYNNII